MKNLNIEILVSAIVVLFLAGCGAHSDSPAAPPAPVPAAPNVPETETVGHIKPAAEKTYSQLVNEGIELSIKESYQSQNTGSGVQTSYNTWGPGVFCAKGVDCQNKFVSITFSDSSSTATCSGVRIAQNKILTNRHCIEVATETPNSSFRDWQIAALIPAAREGAELEISRILGVENLIAVSPKGLKAPFADTDWAILTFKTLSSEKNYAIPKLNREGLNDGETYYVYSTDPMYQTKSSAIVKRECVARYNTIFDPTFDQPKDAVIALSNCPIGPGNSGSPIYNKAGELVGIIGGQFNPHLLEVYSIMASHAYDMLDSKPSFNHLGWGANLACIPDFENPAARIPTECDVDFMTSARKFQIGEDLAGEAIRRLDDTEAPSKKFSFKSERSVVAQFALKSLTDALFLRIPECIKPESLSSLTSEDLKFVIQTVGVSLTQDGLSLNKLGKVNGNLMRAEFDLEKAKTGKTVPMKIYFEANNHLLHERTIGVCAH